MVFILSCKITTKKWNMQDNGVKIKKNVVQFAYVIFL